MPSMQRKLLRLVKTKNMLGKFKKLTLESKVFYVLMTSILIWFMLVLLNGCASSIYKVRKDHIKVTHVLAITEIGDTLKIPIESIKPNIIYNVVGYDYMRYNPYYSPYNNRYYYDNTPYNFSNNTNYSGGSFGISSINPTIQIPVPSSGGNYSGTSGFSGNPVASNPVTNGGMKTKN